MLLSACGNHPSVVNSSSSSPDSTAKHEEGFVQIFDGQTLAGWEADTAFWKVANGVITGEVTPEKPLKNNTFIIWSGGSPGNFEFKAEYRISAEGNSGVQYRSEKVAGIPYALRGYQADIDGANVYTGQNYEERGRGFLAMRGQISELSDTARPLIKGWIGNPDSLKTRLKVNDWNEVHIIAKDNHLTHYVNGILMSEVRDNDTVNRKLQGMLGLQLHVMPSMKVEYRRLRIKQ